jgi:hypothetical protein
MIRLRPQYLLILLACMSSIACERDNYSTWNCTSSKESKTTMVLKKAEMQFQETSLDYCGSLGERSYFSKKCPANIQDADYVFTPSSGTLHSTAQDYQCTVL